MSHAIRRFFGGSPAWVILRLVVISVLVGLVLSALNLDPTELYYRMRALVLALWNMGFGAIEAAARYLIAGAIIVVPVWLILRILNMNRRGP